MSRFTDPVKVIVVKKGKNTPEVEKFLEEEKKKVEKNVNR